MSIILDQSSPKLDVHSKIRMFPHQQALAHKLMDMEMQPKKSTFIGVLKDPPGSGKSFPLLALILHEKRTFGQTQNLLVIPHNIHEQWLTYISEFSDELNAKSLMYYGDVTSLFYDRRLLYEYDILITTSTFYPMVTTTVNDIGAWFSRVIIDEIDSISFFTTVKVPSQSVWLVSATAELTRNGAYMENAMQNTITCDPMFIKKSINLPPPIVEHHTCFNEYVQILQHDVVKDIKSVYACDFSQFRFEYLRNEKINSPKDLLSATFRDHCLGLHSVMDSIEKLQQGSTIHVSLVESLRLAVEKKEKFTEAIENIINLMARKKCPMCCDNFADKEKRIITPCCSTMFCSECMDKMKLLTDKCPRCYTELPDELSVDENQVIPVPVKSALPDKMEEFETILGKEINRDNFRILIFSDFTGTFLEVQKILKKYNLKHAEIEGNQYTMTKAIKYYKTGRRPILLVDSMAYGSGVNLEITTAVIVIHKTEREHQIVGRAQRLGRMEQLHVHHLLYPGE